MTVVLAGGSGFLGRALHKRLRDRGHFVRVLTRQPSGPTDIAWQPDGTAAGSWADAVAEADVVVNLAGAGIADARWTAARKQVLRDSRILSTRSLAHSIRLSRRTPIFVSASGVGYYGDRAADLVTEETPPGTDFLAQLCVEWEREAEKVADVSRVVILRNGLVMHPSGGALALMLLPFRIGVGGRLGSGRQYLPWIHLEDWLALAAHLIELKEARGPFNATAPTPATNAEFTRALGHALRRPTLLPAPALALRAALGELADTLLTGQRAVPERAQATGFVFRFGEIDRALKDLLR